MARYDDAKAVALGLSPAPPAQDFSSGGFGVTAGSAGMRPQAPYQYFNKGIEPPSELIAHKSALSLFKEYDKDKKNARKLLSKTLALIEKDDAGGVEKLLGKNLFADWLSFVFLSEQDIDGFVTAVSGAAKDVRTAVAAGANAELVRLINFKELLAKLVEVSADGQGDED